MEPDGRNDNFLLRTKDFKHTARACVRADERARARVRVRVRVRACVE